MQVARQSFATGPNATALLLQPGVADFDLYPESRQTLEPLFKTALSGETVREPAFRMRRVKNRRTGTSSPRSHEVIEQRVEERTMVELADAIHATLSVRSTIGGGTPISVFWTEPEG